MDQGSSPSQRARGAVLNVIRPYRKPLAYLLVAVAAFLLSLVNDEPEGLPSRAASTRSEPHFFTLSAAEPAKLDWNQLRALDMKTGAAPPALKQLNGKMVGMAGFMVPLEDDDDNVSEFLLVPWTGACIHTPPPPPNQIVDVITNGQKIKVDIDNPIWVNARLQISTVKSPYGNVAYQMTNGSVRPYDEN